MDLKRVSLLPMEASTEDVTKVLNNVDLTSTSFTNKIESFTYDAIEYRFDLSSDSKRAGVEILLPLTIASTFRIEFADPVRDNRYFEQFPEESSERNMMTKPFHKYPGLSRFTREIRRAYIFNVLNIFKHEISTDLQEEFVGILFAPGNEFDFSNPSSPAQAYVPENSPQGKSVDNFGNDVTKTDDGFIIQTENPSYRLAIDPHFNSHYISEEDDEKPYLIVTEDGIYLPEKSVFVKLWEYAYHSWHYLIQLSYPAIPEYFINEWVEGTDAVREILEWNLEYSNNRRAFIPHYGSQSSNPLTDQDMGDRITRQDKRIVSAVDAIRQKDDLQFGENIPVEDLYGAICDFYPSPSRPSNNISERETLQNAFRNAEGAIQLYDNEASVKIPRPYLSPFYRDDEHRFWKSYRHELAKLTQKQLNLPVGKKIALELPEDERPRNSPNYKHEIQKSNSRAVSTTQYGFPSIESVFPLVNPSEIEGLTRDEVLFLTRVGLAMDRLIDSFSLVDSMASLENIESVGRDNVDLEKLTNEYGLTAYNLRKKYYNVPWTTREKLGLPNISNSGWGERSPSESTKHRLGVDLTALAFAQRPSIEKVIRYVDIWRLQQYNVWDGELADIKKKRFDVVGFSSKGVEAVAEIETDTGGKDSAGRTLRKLERLPPSVEKSLVAPNGEELSTFISRISASSDIEYNFGNKDTHSYRPSELTEEIQSAGDLDLDVLFTYQNLRDSLPEPEAIIRLSKVVTGRI